MRNCSQFFLFFSYKTWHRFPVWQRLQGLSWSSAAVLQPRLTLMQFLPSPSSLLGCRKLLDLWSHWLGAAQLYHGHFHLGKCAVSWRKGVGDDGVLWLLWQAEDEVFFWWSGTHVQRYGKFASSTVTDFMVSCKQEAAVCSPCHVLPSTTWDSHMQNSF